MAIQRTTLNARRRELNTRQAENEAITYTIDYSAHLDTDKILTSTWSSEDNGVVIANESIAPVLTGTNDSVSAGLLVDSSGGAFITSDVEIGELVENTSTNETALITNVVADGILTLSSDIFPLSGVGYSITLKAKKTSATLSGDVGRYRVVNKVTTSGGLTLERYIDLTIMDNSKRYTTDYWLSYLGWR